MYPIPLLPMYKVELESGWGRSFVPHRPGRMLGVRSVGHPSAAEYPANRGWGDPENRTMFFTANTSTYSMLMKPLGTPIPGA